MSGPQLPVQSLGEATPFFRRPFTSAAVRFKLQTSSMVVAYIDARLVIERLNTVLPDGWSDTYAPTNDPKHLLCKLTIDNVTREDVGKASDNEGIKGMYSDAFKRAAVKFGVGVYLYSLPRWFVEDGDIKMRNGKAAGLTGSGERKLRQLYEQWLTGAGKKAFGDPLDHGDSLEAVGDYETAADPIRPALPEVPLPPAPVPLSKSGIDFLVAAKKAAGVDDEWVRTRLVALGVADVPEGRVTVATIRRLTVEQAMALTEALEKETAK